MRRTATARRRTLLHGWASVRYAVASKIITHPILILKPSSIKATASYTQHGRGGQTEGTARLVRELHELSQGDFIGAAQKVAEEAAAGATLRSRASARGTAVGT